MKLQEVFDKPEKIQWKQKNKETYDGHFKIAGITYAFYASRDVFAIDDKDYYGYDIDFSLIDYDDEVEEKMTADKFGSGASAYGITGTGNQYKIFSTVIAGLKELVKTQKPSFIHFSANEKSRQKLYNRLVKVLGSSLGYKLSKKASGIGSYTLYRKNQFEEIESNR
jgi:hypothetical protein